MPIPLTRRIRAMVLSTTLVALIVSGCSSSEDSDSASSHGFDAAVVVSAAHANSPVPSLDEMGAEIIDEILHANGPVDVITVSGQPSLVDDLDLVEVEGTPRGRDALVRKNVSAVEEAVSKPSQMDGADDLDAVAMGADRLRSTGASNPVLFYSGSGLSDRGRMAFTVPGMITADPAEVAAHLSRTGGLPVLTGITVVLSGIGYTAGPQDPLDSGQRAHVTEIWSEVLQSAGATVVVNPAPRTGPPVETTAVVNVVEVPEIGTPPQCNEEEIVFTDQSEVSFVAETAQFVDEAKALPALESLASWLAEDPRRTAVIRGTTADDRGDRERLRRLGSLRANAVATVLTDHGVGSQQLTTIGVGADFPEYVRPDIDPTSGELLPGPASLNRSVRIALVDPC